jgi:long-chain acyl-CoA synthetase
MSPRTDAIAVLTGPGQPYELETVQANGRAVRWFRNGPASLRAMYEASRGGKPFVLYQDEHYSFEEMWRRTCTLAHALVDDYGIKVGDRVAISMRNYPEWLAAFSAITSVGAVAVGLNALWQPAELAYGLKDAGAKLLIADQERLDRLAACGEAFPDLALIGVRTTGPMASGRTWDEVIGQASRDSLPDVAFGADDDALMFYTSGSTGSPKGAVSSHRAVLAALLSWEMDREISYYLGAARPGVDATQPSILVVAPLFHVLGCEFGYLSSYRPQRRMVLMYKWDVEAAARLIEKERITTFSGPPAMTGDLVEAARRLNLDMTSLTYVGGGGAARAPEQVKAISQVFGPAAQPGVGWGMTETNAIGTGVSGPDYLSHPTSAGRSSVVLDLRVANEAGESLANGERGELQVRGASMMRGYWNKPEATAASYEGDWFRTGDVAVIDDDGFVYIVDRLKDLVIRGGENIGCGGVEGELAAHPDVLEASVYGVPDARLGEEVGATLYVRQPVDEDALRVFLATRLPRHEIPRYIHQMTEPLPRIAAGKFDKRTLKAEAIARLGL